MPDVKLERIRRYNRYTVRAVENSPTTVTCDTSMILDQVKHAFDCEVRSNQNVNRLRLDITYKGLLFDISVTPIETTDMTTIDGINGSLTVFSGD